MGIQQGEIVVTPASEDTGGPVRGEKGGQNLRDFASNTAERKRGIRTKLHPVGEL